MDCSGRCNGISRLDKSAGILCQPTRPVRVRLHRPKGAPRPIIGHAFPRLRPDMTRFRIAAVLLAASCGIASAIAQTPQDLPTIKLTMGIHNIRAQVAQTDEQRMTGLMHRPTMPSNEGMLFIFPAPAQQCFWMKNTLLPL